MAGADSVYARTPGDPSVAKLRRFFELEFACRFAPFLQFADEAESLFGRQQPAANAALSAEKGAWAAAATKDCFLKGKFWRIVTKWGGEKAPAIIAVAHTLLLLVYKVLQTKQPFEDRTAPPVDDRQKERLIRHHIRRLGKLGIAIQAVAPSRSGTSKPRPLGQDRPPRTDRPRSDSPL